MHGSPSADQRNGTEARRQKSTTQVRRLEHFTQWLSFGMSRRDLFPPLGLRHKESDEEHQHGGESANEQDETPALLRDVKSHPDDSDERKSNVSRGADDSREHRSAVFRPDLHDEGDAEGPFSAHAKRSHESESSEVPGLLREVRQAGEHRVAENAKAHRPHPSDAIAQPAKKDAAECCTDQKQRGDDPHPVPDKCIGHHAGGLGLHLLQRRSRDQRKDAHFQTVEHPAQKGGEQDQPRPGATF